MIGRRVILTGLGGVAFAAGGYTTGAYRAALSGAEARLALRSSLINSSAGALEYAVARSGSPLMIQGTGACARLCPRRRRDAHLILIGSIIHIIQTRQT